MSSAGALPRLLRGIEDGRTLTLAQHLRVHGPLEAPGRDAGARLLDAVEDSGLRGRGGAYVSAALKLRAVAGRRRRAVVVANGSESEPASRKDAVLLAHTPHLVIDGALVAATAVGADEAVLYVKRSDPRVWSAVLRAIDERRAAGARGPALRVVSAPPSYLSGQRPPRSPTSTAGGRCRRPSRRGRSSAASTTARRSSATWRRWRTWRSSPAMGPPGSARSDRRRSPGACS
jgi:respiratory-subunit NADH dehydrogenase subunit